MKKIRFYLAILLFINVLYSCSKEGSDITPTSKPLITHTLKVYSVINTNSGLDAARTGYINLYDSEVYTEASAAARSAKIDLVYKYRVQGGPKYYRAFFNMQIQDDQFKQGFTTLTNCQVASVGQTVTNEEFNALKTAKDIDDLFVKKALITSGNDNYAYVSNQVADAEFNRIFAFVDKAGKKGFFITGDYTPKVPAGSEAEMTLQIKIQP